MTKLVLLSADKQREFDAPSKLNAKKRTLFFSFDYDIIDFVKTLRTPITQIGFTLQLGYFRANGKFFTPQQFRSPDIDHVCKVLGISSDTLNMAHYQEKAIRDHRRKILELLQWHPLDSNNQEKIKEHIQWHIPQQLSPKRVFYTVIEYCCRNKIELPSYHLLSTLITNAYNVFEKNLIQEITQKLTKEHREKLDQILRKDDIDLINPMSRSPLTHLKKISQSLRPFDIKETLSDFNLFKDYFCTFKSIIEELSLSDQITEYFAIWVQKATSF